MCAMSLKIGNTKTCFLGLLGLALVFFAQPAGAAGNVALDFTLPTVDGGELSLSDFKGRVVIIDFFGTWCGPCKIALNNLGKLQKKYGKKGLSVLGYALDAQGIKKVRPFVAKLGIDFPVVLGNLKEGRRLTSIEVLPTTLVIDPKGRKVARFEGHVSPSRLISTVSSFFSKSPPPEPKVAKTHRRKDGQRRFQRIWPIYERSLGSQTGMYVHVMADVADLVAEQGLWLALHLRPEARSGSGLAPLSKAKTLYLRIDDVSQRHFIMFVRCDQFPASPVGGVYRSWVTILDPKLKQVERSGEFILDRPACVTAQAR